MSKHTFKVYNKHGKLVLSTWTSAPATYAAEREAFQERLNRCELFWVEVTSDDPHEEAFKMWPQQVRRNGEPT